MNFEEYVDKITEKYLDTIGYVSGFYFVFSLALKVESHLEGDPLTYKEALNETKDIFSKQPVKDFRKTLESLC
tara:strand:+ start:133 stop:351 length:219 start_codon:yes stop_codon:yes gene_type:complete